MLLIITSIALTVLFNKLVKRGKLGVMVGSALCSVILVLGFGIGILAPIAGYEEPTKEEIQLAPLVSKSGEEYFLQIVADYYFFKQKKSDYEEDKTYMVTNNYLDDDDISIISIEIVETETNEAILEIQEKKPKRSFLTFALLGTTYKTYTFYVPAGSIEAIMLNVTTFEQ